MTVGKVSDFRLNLSRGRVPGLEPTGAPAAF